MTKWENSFSYLKVNKAKITPKIHAVISSDELSGVYPTSHTPVVFFVLSFANHIVMNANILQ